MVLPMQFIMFSFIVILVYSCKCETVLFSNQFLSVFDTYYQLHADINYVVKLLAYDFFLFFTCLFNKTGPLQRALQEALYLLLHMEQIKPSVAVQVFDYCSNVIITWSLCPCHSISPSKSTSLCFLARRRIPTSLLEIVT